MAPVVLQGARPVQHGRGRHSAPVGVWHGQQPRLGRADALPGRPPGAVRAVRPDPRAPGDAANQRNVSGLLDLGFGVITQIYLQSEVWKKRTKDNRTEDNQSVRAVRPGPRAPQDATDQRNVSYFSYHVPSI